MRRRSRAGSKLAKAREGDDFRTVAMHGASQALVDARLHKLRHNTALGRTIQTKDAVQIEDIAADQAYTERDPWRVASVELGGVRTLLSVPLLKDSEVIGAISIYRDVVRPFTDKQIELVKNFAAQAVIAIENTRLLNELRQRTADLTESLEQQTATSEVLKVISSSPGELEPVFNALLANAIRICEATYGILLLFEGNSFRAVAVQSRESYKELLQRNPVIDLRDNPGIPLDRIAKNKQVVHITDLRNDQSYIAKRDPIVRLVEVGGIRTHVGVPMLKEGELIGSINMYRQEVRPFTDKQIELVKNFGAQAVIAIENARLLSELRQRTTDLTESLEQQTATSQVLSIISTSPAELEPVFQAILANATRLCEAKFGNLYLYDGRTFRTVATHNGPAAYVELRMREPIAAHPMIPMGRAVLTKQPVHIPDARADPAYIERFPGMVALV